MIFGIDDSYKKLLLRSNCASVYQRQLQFLVTEYLKAYLKSIQNPCGRSLSRKRLLLQFYATFILQFKKGAYSKHTKDSVHLLWLKCCSRPSSLSNLFFWTILVALRLFKQFQFKIRATKSVREIWGNVFGELSVGKLP